MKNLERRQVEVLDHVGRQVPALDSIPGLLQDFVRPAVRKSDVVSMPHAGVEVP